MLVKKVINNNVCIGEINNGDEIVAFGKGITYGRKVGDMICDNIIEKRYVYKENESPNRIHELLAKVPEKYFDVCNDIVLYANEILDKDIDSSIYIMLIDHINMAVKRYLKGISVPNIMLLDIKRFYPEEYKVGVKALEILRKQLKVDLPEDEAGFITFHIVNAFNNYENVSISKTMRLVKEVNNLVKYYLSLDIDENSIYYLRFLTHLKFFSQRLLSDSEVDLDKPNTLLELVKNQYSKSYECSIRIEEFILEKYKKRISNEEKLYLTVHIQNISERC